MDLIKKLSSAVCLANYVSLPLDTALLSLEIKSRLLKRIDWYRDVDRIIDIALLRTRTVMLAFLMILTAGVISYIDIPKEADPDIPIPIIYILLKHDGISPEDSERQLLQSIEPKLRSIEGVKEVRSSAYTGGANIILCLLYTSDAADE